MVKSYSYSLLFCIALLSPLRVAGQMALPDTVGMGQTRRYYVDPNPVPGSTYIWRIDGVTQSGFTTNEFVHTWNTADTYFLEEQELSADGCPGPVRSGQVTVIDNTLPVAICRDISLDLDLMTGIASITASDINNGSFDNCGIASMAVSIRNFDCKNIGSNNVILIVTDNSGNTATCTSVVTVNYSANPVVTPATDVICDKETTNIRLTSDIPGTTWTWTVNSSSEISGASGGNSGLNSSIIQHLNNRDLIVHNVIYNIIPGVYGKCNLVPITAEVWVNPTPEIEVDMRDTVICDEKSTTISVQNLNTIVRGQWMYYLTVEPDAGITGNSISGTFTTATDLTETLFNSDTIRHKVIYRFTPFIVPDDGGPVCGGKEKKFTIWVHPGLRYTAERSDFNGFNISCFGKSNGFINIEPSMELAPFTFMWTGPGTFTASTGDLKGLIAGLYTMSITDRNGCTTNETFEMTEPGKLGISIISSVSNDGAYNINCAGGNTGSINVTAFNSVGLVDYLWADGYIGKTRTNLGAATYKVIISDSNGCHGESVVALTEPDPIKLAFDKTDPLCPEKSDGQINLTVTGGISGNAYTYLWSDNSTQPAISNIPAGYYSVTVTDMNGCSVKDSVRLKGMNKICLTVPEAFSPNKDLINDVWNIENTNLYPQIEITIYNRWGQDLWKSKRGYPVPWNGRTTGGDLPVDSYHYIIDLNNGSKPIIGSITIIR